MKVKKFTGGWLKAQCRRSASAGNRAFDEDLREGVLRGRKGNETFWTYPRLCDPRAICTG